ncbi:hypothetical protein DY467_20685 [Rhodopseudomonas sp. BR0G17]|nr:hypothetical protein [Rhodopseudomonas sp. BR0G17]
MIEADLWLLDGTKVLILRSPAKPGVSKDEGTHRLRHMVRDGAARLLTMRVCPCREHSEASLLPSRADCLHYPQPQKSPRKSGAFRCAPLPAPRLSSRRTLA